ncbi:hypothetical protein ACPV5G_20230 [Photobacterium damselae]|uniref:hypothetical protein n=1 Tax=Photobacterium damselae TaxID=38293 RepID=UPI0040693577
MKHKIIVGALLSMLSSAAFAQMTMADVNRNLDTYDRYVPPQSEMDYRWKKYNEVPQETTNGQHTVTRYSVSNGTKRLQPTSTHICVVGSAGGEYRRGLKGLNVVVEPKNGYWYLTAKHDSGGSKNWGTATCWNK